jgi:N-acetylglucosaminyl-diphospho-decaprenol L-rhamnosyltransferase
MTPSLDIVIVNHNTADELVACLNSVFGAPPDGLRRVWVVDNASTDDSRARVNAEFPEAVLLALPVNAGFAAANNRAIEQSDADLVLLLNSDTIVPAGAIDMLVARQAATGAVAAGPKLVDGRGRPEVSFGPMLSPWTEWRQRRLVRLAASDRPEDQAAIDRLVADERFVDWVSGACLLVRRADAVAAGLLDERYFLYEEDVDFCAALRARGGRVVFTPAATIQHLRGRSVAKAGATRSPHYDRSHLLFYRKHLPAWAWLLTLGLRVRGRSVR